MDTAQVIAGTMGLLVINATLVDDQGEAASERTDVKVEIGFFSDPNPGWAAAVGSPVFAVGTSIGTAGAGSNWITQANLVDHS